MATSESLKAVPEASQAQDKAKRERSTIVFPYLDLDDAVNVAKGVHMAGGSSCQVDQLAAQLQQPASSSTFQIRINTARIFGLVMYSQGTVTLTPLGTRICDPQQEKGARADSFLNVPLYKAVYEQFKGSALPPPSGLDATMGSLGVAAKQKETARRVFQRSATQSGFFEFGQDRLVYPSIKGSAAVTPAVAPASEPEPEKKKGKDADEDEELHPFIKGLLKKLPPPDSEWPNDKRAKWLQAAVNIFDLMYTESEDDSKRTITIGFQKDSAKQ